MTASKWWTVRVGSQHREVIKCNSVRKSLTVLLGGVGDPEGRRWTVTVGGHQAELVTSERAQAGLSVAQGGGGAKLTATQNKGRRCGAKLIATWSTGWCRMPASAAFPAQNRLKAQDMFEQAETKDREACTWNEVTTQYRSFASSWCIYIYVLRKPTLTASTMLPFKQFPC